MSRVTCLFPFKMDPENRIKLIAHYTNRQCHAAITGRLRVNRQGINSIHW